MPEQRARTYHRNRVANTFSEEIGAMLEGELSDPRIAPSYVTDVVLAPGGKSARIFVAVHGNEEEEASTLEGLMTARAYIRSQLRDRMGVRHVPDLTFAIATINAWNRLAVSFRTTPGNYQPPKRHA